MPNIQFTPASAESLDLLASLWNSGFTGYIGHTPTDMTAATFQDFATKTFVDLALSRVIHVDGTPSGHALIARRGTLVRLAGMCLVSEARGRGVGTVTMEMLIREARERGDTVFELEVIGQNEAGWKLYKKVGFGIYGHLSGWVAEDPQPVGGPVFSDGPLEFVSVQEYADILNLYASPNLPWQIAGFTLAQLTSPPWVVVRLGAAYAMITDPDNGGHIIRAMSFFVMPSHWGEGQATRLLNVLFARYPKRTWKVSPTWPNEHSERLARKFGFRQMEIDQLHMKMDLRAPEPEIDLPPHMMEQLGLPPNENSVWRYDEVEI